MNDYYDHIDDYINGSLTEAERTEFERALSTDPSLQAAVDNYDDATLLSEGLLELDVLETIGKLEGEGGHREGSAEVKQVQRATKTFTLRRWLMVASMVGVVCLSGWWIVNQNEQSRRDKLWASYERPIDPDATKSIDTSRMDRFQLAKYYFALNEFEKSRNVLNTLLENTNNRDTIGQSHFWLAHVYINLGKWKKAKKKWEKSGLESKFLEKI